LLGGETAEHPGLLGVDEYDIAGSTTGVVEADALLGAELVLPGDVVIGMASSGLHSNGFSLVRHVFFDKAGWQLDREVPEFGMTLGEQLLTPTRLYTLPCLALAKDVEVHAMSHITGGGLAANLARVLPPTVSVRLDRASWTPPAVFGLVGELGSVAQADLDLALNMGVGMVALVAPDAADAALRLLAEHGVDAWILGDVAAAGVYGEAGTVTLTGSHPA
jgi:phosphoribosylformylglycinamidine cyclo-ligase